MGGFQKFLLAVLAIGLTTLTLVFWGSIGSAMCVFCLIIMVAALLFRRFVLERDPDDFKFDE